ncbi:hypothetical protein SO802_030677 [Lithocarpus litseifolius]|uniref:RNase H type-1 domain-containing protein n=1 Tax=Lithocarpus litseifolius TaxID=425828 RepID=A0AAW2BI33_9ROSI
MLMLEDMNRFVQELEDREQSEAERKLKEDLDCWIHNQKLAADIHNIPDQQWEKYGDNYHRFYRTATSSSSSSKALVDSKCFRLYFKGLVSEKRFMGIVVNVAGARVAICDSKDNLILEARKNVEAMVNGVVVSGEVAELQALNKALTLDLKKVTFFCDNYMLYQYVSQ